VIETQAGDVSAYIPTNGISITDGQIFLEGGLFNAGVRPAISVGISVSRVGGDAQIRPMNKAAGQMKLELAQFRELAAFSQFASDLDTGTRDQLERGQRLTELLKQDQYAPVSVGLQICEIYAGTRGFLDKVPVNRVKEWQAGYVRFMNSERKAFVDAFETEKKWDDDVIKQLEDSLNAFNRQFGVEDGKKQDPKQAGTAGDRKPEEAAARPEQEPAGAEAAAKPQPRAETKSKTAAPRRERNKKS